MSLRIRKTHKYVGTYKHLDKWEELGSLRIVANGPIEYLDEEDPCEPTKQEFFVRVELESATAASDVEQALRDEFTSESCAHEHDCCGCRSSRTGLIEEIGKGYWRVVIGSSRNF